MKVLQKFRLSLSNQEKFKKIDKINLPTTHPEVFYPEKFILKSQSKLPTETHLEAVVSKEKVDASNRLLKKTKSHALCIHP